MKQVFLLSLLFTLYQNSFSQSVAWQRCNNFEKGQNLSNWLEASWQSGFPTANGYAFNSLVKMKQAGIKSIRLPISFALVTDSLPPYKVDTAHALFSRVDSVISWCETLNMNLVIDNHHNWDIFNQNWRNKIDRFAHLWSVLAARYKYLDPERYTFELLNEPAFGISIDSLNIVFNHAIDSIRQHTTAHTIIVSPNFSSNGAAFANLVPLTDTNLIYTWHCYDPYQFTHQGFTWAQPSVPLGTTFPGAFDQSLYNAWNTVIDWQNTYNKPVFLGEFGAGELADAQSSCNWIEYMGSKIDSFNMPWFYWDWQWDFSMFKSHVISEDSIIPCFKHALHLYGDSLTASVQNTSNEKWIVNIYPNPAENSSSVFLHTSAKEELTATVFDAMGRKLFFQKFYTDCILPVSDWNKGVYFVIIGNNRQIASKKLVID